MKTNTYLLIVLILMPAFELASQTKYGVYAGINLASENAPELKAINNASISYSLPSSGRKSFVGTNIDYVLTPTLKLEFNLVYSLRSYSQQAWVLDTVTVIDTNALVNPVKYDTSLQTFVSSKSKSEFIYNMIDFRPVIYYGLPLGRGKASIGIGPSVSVRLKGSISTIIDSIDNSNHEFKKMNSFPVALGLFGTLKYEFGFGLFFQALYNYIFNLQSEVSVSVVEVGIGYSFYIQRKRSKISKK